VDGWDGSEGDDILEQGADVAEQGGGGLPGLGWFGRLGWRPSRGAVILGAAGLVLGLLAGYAAGYRQVTAGVGPARGAAPAPRAVAVQGAAPASGSSPASASSPKCGPDASPIAWPPFPTVQDGRELIIFCGSAGHGYIPQASPAVTQTTGACSVQLGHELQLGVEVSNQTSSDVTLRQVGVSFPAGGDLRLVSWAWGPCGAISSRAGQLAADSGGQDLSPGESGWFTVTVQVLVTCPTPYPVQFTVQFDSNGRTSFALVQGFNDLGQVPYSGCAGK
jgi:hypothetical protein